MSNTTKMAVLTLALAVAVGCASAPVSAPPNTLALNTGTPVSLVLKKEAVTTTELPTVSEEPSRIFVRLRGSNEIHESDCPRVHRAEPGGVVDAAEGEGPPCFTCQRKQAIAWSR